MATRSEVMKQGLGSYGSNNFDCRSTLVSDQLAIVGGNNTYGFFDGDNNK